MCDTSILCPTNSKRILWPRQQFIDPYGSNHAGVMNSTIQELLNVSSSIFELGMNVEFDPCVSAIINSCTAKIDHVSAITTKIRMDNFGQPPCHRCLRDWHIFDIDQQLDWLT